MKVYTRFPYMRRVSSGGEGRPPFARPVSSTQEEAPKRVPKRLPLQMGAFHEMKGDAVTENASA
jgi:hypothetical protein